MYKSRSKIVSKFVEKLMLKHILTFLGLRFASLIVTYFVVPGIRIPKIRSFG